MKQKDLKAMEYHKKLLLGTKKEKYEVCAISHNQIYIPIHQVYYHNILKKEISRGKPYSVKLKLMGRQIFLNRHDVKSKPSVNKQLKCKICKSTKHFQVFNSSKPYASSTSHSVYPIAFRLESDLIGILSQ